MDMVIVARVPRRYACHRSTIYPIAQALEADLASAQTRMSTASTLLLALGDEETRWSVQLEQYKRGAKALVGDCLLASSFMSYLGPFSKGVRDTLLHKDLAALLQRMAVPITDGFQVGWRLGMHMCAFEGTLASFLRD